MAAKRKAAAKRSAPKRAPRKGLGGRGVHYEPATPAATELEDKLGDIERRLTELERGADRLMIKHGLS